MVDMTTTDNGLTRLIFNVPARGMIGYTTEFMSMTKVTVLLTIHLKNLDHVLKHKLAVVVMVR